MPGLAATYAVAIFAMLVAATAAVTLIFAVRHFDPPEVSAPAQEGSVDVAA